MSLFQKRTFSVKIESNLQNKLHLSEHLGSVLPRERAYFEPEGSSEREDEEEDFVPNFAARRKLSSRNAEVSTEEAPPVPSRSGENKHLMLKLMKNATNALKSK